MTVQFTRSEFDIMVQELLYDEEMSFDMLCHIAEKTLRNSVRKWCKEDPCLAGKEYENDIMQEIHLRLITRTVTHFLLRGGVGEVNDDPEGFEDWMFTLAKNIKRDFANEVRKRNARTDDTDPDGVGVSPDPGTELLPGMGKLQQAAAIVLQAKASIYKILTWLAQAVVIAGENVSKLESNEILLHNFENRTLYEMYSFILSRAEGLPWLSVSQAQKSSIEHALEKEWQDGIPYGEARYKDFFMKKSGVPCGKKSISDWVNRMNDLIKRKMHGKIEASGAGCPAEEKGAAK